MPHHNPHAHQPTGVYDAFGTELHHDHVALHFHHLLGEKVTKLAQRHHEVSRLAAEHAHDPEHPIHRALKASHDDLTDATHGRLSGTWRVERFDAPVEWYARKLAGAHFDIVPSNLDDLDFQYLPASLRTAAIEAMRRQNHPVTTEFASTFENLFLTAGVTALWQQAEGNTSAANTGAAAANVYAAYNNAQARIGVGDSTTAAAAAQTDLQAATNKYYVGMDATYPTQATNQTVFRATFASANANYAWQEFVVDNCNGSNSTATTRSGGTTLDRVVSSQGSKAAGQTWQPSLTISIS